MAGYTPPTGFHFSVNFGEVSTMQNDTLFQSVSGLNIEMETENYKEGGENRFDHVLPVRTRYSNLVLNRGMLVDSKVIEWCLKTFETLTIKPANIVISLLNEKHEPLVTWNIVNAWPVKWSVNGMNAEESRLFIETLELRYQYFTKV